MAMTLDIGYASNPDGLADGISAATAAQVAFTAGTMPADALVPAPLGATDTKITATIASLGSGVVTTGGKIAFHIAYKMPA